MQGYYHWFSFLRSALIPEEEKFPNATHNLQESNPTETLAPLQAFLKG